MTRGYRQRQRCTERLEGLRGSSSAAQLRQQRLEGLAAVGDLPPFCEKTELVNVTREF